MKHRRLGAEEGLEHGEVCQQVDRSDGEVMQKWELGPKDEYSEKNF